VWRFVHRESNGEKRCVEAWGEIPGRDILVELGAPADGYRPKGIFHVELTYGPDPYETTLRDAMGNVHRYRGNALGLVERYVDPLGYQRLLSYDATGKLLRVMDGAGITVKKSFDMSGQLASLTTGAGETARFRADPEAGTVTTFAPGNYKSVERLVKGRIVERTDALGNKTLADWNDRGLNTKVTFPDGASDTLEHDAHGNLVKYTSGKSVWTYEYDLLGQPVRVTTPEGGTTRLEYDSRGVLVTVIDPLGRRLEHAADVLGRRVITSYPGSGTARYRFVADALVEQILPDGTVYRMGYDALLRLRWVENPAGERHVMEYDAAGNKVREQTFAGLVYAYEPDGGGRVASLLRPDESRVRFVRDGSGRLLATEHSNGVTERIEYDDFGRITRVSNGTTSVELLYGANGALVRDTQRCGGWAFSVDYRYDEHGKLVGRKYSTGWAVAIENDDRGRASVLSVGPKDRAERFVFERDREGKEVARRREGSELSLVTKRNAMGYPTEVALEGQDGEKLRARTYTWDACGPLGRVADNTRGDRRFTLDPHGRPLEVSGLGAQESFAIAPQGTAVPRKMTWSVGPGGRPVRTEDAILHWDRGGRLAMRQAQDPSKSWQFTYDENDRLKSAVRSDGLKIDYIYDPLGRRIAEVCGNSSTWFGWDGDSIVEERPTSGRVTTRVFDRAEPHRPLLEAQDGASFRMVATDAASTPWLYVDEDGALSEIDLTTWGETAFTSGEPGALRFAGQRADALTGLFYNRNRYYAPDLHVYTTPDPIGLLGSIQDVGFVKNPTYYIDPLGLLTIITASNDPNLANAYYSNYAAQYPGATILTPSQVTPGSLKGETDVVIDTHGAPGSVEWAGNNITGSQLADKLKGAGFAGGPGTRVEVIACNSNTSPGGLFGRSVAQAVADRTGATTSGASAVAIGDQNATQTGNAGTSGLLSGMPTGLGSGNPPGGMAVNGGGNYDGNVKPRWWTFGF
jgi:RHS repeat-associated protein